MNDSMPYLFLLVFLSSAQRARSGFCSMLEKRRNHLEKGKRKRKNDKKPQLYLYLILFIQSPPIPSRKVSNNSKERRREKKNHEAGGANPSTYLKTPPARRGDQTKPIQNQNQNQHQKKTLAYVGLRRTHHRTVAW